jgi:hypothetical protein
MRKRVFLAPFALLVCGTHQRVGLDQVPPGSKCEQSTALNSFIGQPASTALAAQMVAAARAPKLRWVAAGAPVTMDHSSRRLTVQLDSQNRVVSATCG